MPVSLAPLPPPTPLPAPPSPLVICDRLLTLAEDAHRAGLTTTAEHLVHLADRLFDEPRLEPG